MRDTAATLRMSGRVTAFCVGLALLATLAGCGSGTAPATTTAQAGGATGTTVAANESVVLKVAVLDTGVLLVNGETASITQLDAALTQLDKENGVVWYYRTLTTADPPAIVQQVIDLIVHHKRPFHLSSSPTFSDLTGAGGGSGSTDTTG
jgi:hypothetical protein